MCDDTIVIRVTIAMKDHFDTLVSFGPTTLLSHASTAKLFALLVAGLPESCLTLGMSVPTPNRIPPTAVPMNSDEQRSGTALEPDDPRLPEWIQWSGPHPPREAEIPPCADSCCRVCPLVGIVPCQVDFVTDPRSPQPARFHPRRALPPRWPFGRHQRVRQIPRFLRV